ncbi:MAG: type I restriction endonuclease subunit R [Gammaproteobacteria bacterium]|nr:type I restriction endonuclease subunit R [Gammaproteobacteria bacterium]
MALVTEDQVELQSIEWFKDLGYQYQCGYDIAVDGETPERHNYRSVVLKDRILSALFRINPEIPKSAIDSALSQLINPNIPALISCNRQVHSWLTKGLKVTYHEGNQEIGKQIKVIDCDNPENNDWLVVNQFTIHGQRQNRRPDVLIFINGLPLSVVELKNAADEKADIWAAYNQLQTYKNDIPDLFNYNTCLVISDGIYARFGSLSANEERFMRWRTIDGAKIDPFGQHRELETLIKGLFNKQVFLSYLRYFCIFEDEKTVIKKIAGYHQFHAVQMAVENVVIASGQEGSKKGGVVWQTQGAGKSLEMACLAGRLISEPRLQNPTLVIVTDRQELDGQLFGVFAGAGDLLGETPKQASSRSELREHLKNRPSGGIIFTTIQKFGLEAAEDRFPVLTDRHNIVVIADEAHRSQYGFKAKIDSESGVIKYGFARSLRDGLPNATFLAFTGTPISQNDKDTQAVFGEYISIYDIEQAVQDGATVPIYYESRLARINLNHSALPAVDAGVEELLDSENADDKEREKAKSQWSALAAIVGTDARLQEVAEDLILHFETRSQTQPGKALIVTMSRDICARLYDKLVALKPHWHSEDHQQGVIKVIMTASASDKAHLQPHHTNKAQKKDLEKRFKDPDNPLKIVIVRDMWLTGFDAPCLATMYIDKPMHGANLAQAIRAPLMKGNSDPGVKPKKDVDYELQQLVSQAVVGEGVTDIFKLAGLESPDISILSEDFLAEVMKMPHKNLAVELLQRLIRDEVKSRFRTNVVKQRKFSDLLEKSLGKYANRAIEAAQVIEELIAMAEQFKEDLARRKAHNLSIEEEAFYDALARNKSAQELMGEKVLVEMAREIAKKLRDNLTVDWAVRESVRARLRLLIRTLLKRYKYPPDQEQDAVDMVLRQAEVISEDSMSE